MRAAAKILLPEDVVVAPIANLPPDLSSRLDDEADGYYVTRAHTRSGSIIVDAQTAALLQQFRKPSTVVDAIIAFSRANELDPRRTLEDAYVTLSDLVAARMLVPTESPLAQPIASSLSVGTSVNDLTILEPIHVLDDTEVYRCHAADETIVALKIVGSNIRPNTTAAIHHEANVLSGLDGKVNPRFLAAGSFNGRSFLVTTWHSGVDLYRAASEARALPEPGRSQAIVKIAEQILRAYAHLHSQDTLHGDVHPRNLLVDENDRIVILDFGLAIVQLAGWIGLHGGIDLFQAPEIARARLLSRVHPPSFASEQYSIGTLLYFLITGGHTHSFSLQPDAMLKQLVDEPILPFSHHGANNFAWLEPCINRALAKEPCGRYASIHELLQSFLHAAETHSTLCSPPSKRNSFPNDQTQIVLENVLARLSVDADLYTKGLAPPKGSIAYGSAGIAYFLLRIARSRGDEMLLASADVWVSKAALAISSPDMFWNAEQGITPEALGQSSLFHHAAGIYCVQALIAHARGDEAAQQRAVAAYTAATELCDQVDVAFGQSGLLIGCAMLLEITSPHMDSSSLLMLGQRLLQSIWARLDDQLALMKNTTMTTLGAAHGWCGYLFATLRWCEASNTVPPAQLGERLMQLAAMGRSAGRGMDWPRKGPDVASSTVLSASWCNGSAGFVNLWMMGWRLLGYDSTFERLARMAAWHSYEGSSDAPGDLCCGLAGRAYALLHLYKFTGELAWLERARVLAARAASIPGMPLNRLNSLFHGDLGIALLAADLVSPEFSCMPFFEKEYWPDRQSTQAVPALGLL